MANVKTISPARRVLAALGLFAAIIGGIAIGYLIVQWMSPGQPQPSDAEPWREEGVGGAVVAAVLLIGAGGFLTFLFVGVYTVAVVTNLLTLDLTRPVWHSMRTRLYWANMFIPLILFTAMGCFVTALVAPTLRAAGMSGALPFMLPWFGTFIVLQFASAWFNFWTPIETRFVRSRLKAMGVTPAELQSGRCIGVSDPTLKKPTRRGAIEEDMGMLWITPDALTYRGDGDEFRITRPDLLEISRLANTGDTEAYFGVRHIVLRHHTPDGRERQTRLHTEGCWTATGKAKAMNQLAQDIEAWRAGA